MIRSLFFKQPLTSCRKNRYSYPHFFSLFSCSASLLSSLWSTIGLLGGLWTVHLPHPFFASRPVVLSHHFCFSSVTVCDRICRNSIRSLFFPSQRHFTYLSSQHPRDFLTFCFISRDTYRTFVSFNLPTAIHEFTSWHSPCSHFIPSSAMNTATSLNPRCQLSSFPS